MKEQAVSAGPAGGDQLAALDELADARGGAKAQDGRDFGGVEEISRVHAEEFGI